jgi:ADP-ribose pyrophosphatase YjhB (NUDIX family)
MLVRDTDDRVLLCRLTYKEDWDLPGGVVEVHESPQIAVSREVAEELSLDIEADSLLLTDWLPSWSGWDDALCLVFDGGVHEPTLLDEVVVQPREIRTAEFCTLEQVRERCATSRRAGSSRRWPTRTGTGRPTRSRGVPEPAGSDSDLGLLQGEGDRPHQLRVVTTRGAHDRDVLGGRTDRAGAQRRAQWIEQPLAGRLSRAADRADHRAVWNDFLFAIFLSNNRNGPVTIALNALAGGQLSNYAASMAGAMIASVPTLIVYILLGRYFVGGLMAGSVKG